MKKILFTTLLLVIIVLCENSIAKSTIYKCQDEFGRPIFSQQASCDKPEMVNYSSKKRADKQKNNQQKKQQSAEQKQQQQCDEAKTTFSSYKRAPFLTKQVQMDEKSIKVRLSKEEAQQAILDAEQEVEYWCKSKN